MPDLLDCNVKTWVNADYLRLERPSSVKIDPYRCIVVSNNICPCAESEPFLRLKRRNLAMLRAFTVGFKKVYKSCLLFFVSLSGLMDTILNSCQLQGCFYDCLWSGDKSLWCRSISSAYHCWPELWHYNFCFVQSGEAYDSIW